MNKLFISKPFQRQKFKYSQILNPNNKTTLKEYKNLDSSNRNYSNLISSLNSYSNSTKLTNIIFADLYLSKSCYDKNAFILFEYYLINNIDEPFYIINNESDFYFNLLKENKTKNLIIYNEKKKNFEEELFPYLKDTKIIISSYSIRLLQIIASYVSYIKYLKINHGIKYFKIFTAKIDILKSLGNKTNVICSSPFEYELLTKTLNYTKEQIHNASLVRYERFHFLRKNKLEKKCILVSFTYRKYDKFIFEKSEYKKNLEDFLNDEELIKSLSINKIDLIYIPHHEEIDLGKNYSQKIYKYALIKSQIYLEHYIEQCSLFITDISSIAFDFMFQNKPVLFYAIDINENYSYPGKKYMNQPNYTIYFGNFFLNKYLLVDKIKYYINNTFDIGNELKTKYDSIFFIKTNIISKTIEIINKIIRRK